MHKYKYKLKLFISQSWLEKEMQNAKKSYFSNKNYHLLLPDVLEIQ